LEEHLTLRDIKSIPEGLESLLSSLPKELERLEKLVEGFPPRRVILVGSGTSYYAALASSYAFKGMEVLVSPSSEFYLYPPAGLGVDDLIVLFSRSGETTEVLRALKLAKEASCKVVSLTHNPRSPLAKGADASIFIKVGPEGSVLMTKTFSGLTLAGILLGSKLSGNGVEIKGVKNLPRAIDGALKAADAHLKKLAEVILKENRYIFCLGAGPCYAAASECALKFIECSEMPAQGLHLMEFRHGFKVLSYKARLFVLSPKGSSLGEALRLAEEARELGAEVTVITNAEVNNLETLKADWEGDEILAPLLFAPLVQLVAYHVAVLKGLNPDKPRNLSRVVRLD